MARATSGDGITRRDFMRCASVAAAAGAATGAGVAPAAAQEAAGPGSIPRRVLGKTEIEVSVASFGSYGLTNPGVLDEALDAGVNLIDTGPRYAEGEAERYIGKVLAKRRDEAVISTKFSDTSPGVTKEEMLQQVDASLRRLQTDRIDVMQIAMVDSPEAFKNPVVYEAFADAKQAGKILHLGFSAHDANLPAVVAEAIEHEEIAAMVIRYNVMQYENLEELLAQAHEKGVGVIAMKLGAGNRDQELKEFAIDGDMQGAAVRWALANDSVTSVCCGMLTFEKVRQFTKAVQEPLTEADLDVLRRYRVAFDSVYCRGCRTCQGSCPTGVAVSQISRFAMYFRHYGFEKDAMRQYAELPEGARAAACEACDGPCATACPYGLETRDAMTEAHRMLT